MNSSIPSPSYPLHPVRFVFGAGTSRIAYWLQEEQDGMYFLVHRGAIPMLIESKAERFLKKIPGAQLAPNEPVEVSVSKTVRAIHRPKGLKAGTFLTNIDMIEDLYLTVAQMRPEAATPEPRRWREVIIQARNGFFDDLSVAEVVDRVSADALTGAIFGLWGVSLTYCSWPTAKSH